MIRVARLGITGGHTLSEQMVRAAREQFAPTVKPAAAPPAELLADLTDIDLEDTAAPARRTPPPSRPRRSPPPSEQAPPRDPFEEARRVPRNVRNLIRVAILLFIAIALLRRIDLGSLIDTIFEGDTSPPSQTASSVVQVSWTLLASTRPWGTVPGSKPSPS